MSDLPPSTPAPGAGEAADVGTPLESPRPRGRRTAVIAAVAVAVLAVLGGGAAAAAFLLGGGGTQPEEVLPAATLAEISVDLDPSAAQKIQALETLRKFPGLKQQLGLGSSDDVRKWIFDEAVKDTGCRHVDFDQDVAPWLGDRAALAAVDLAGTEPAPAVALQVSDEAKAKAGIQQLVDCGHPGDDFGYAFAPGYVVLSDSTAHARTIVTAGEQTPLAADPGYIRWDGAVGGRGVVNFYVGKNTADWVTRNLGELSDGQVTGSQLGAFGKRFRHFEGLSGTVRFSDGGVEVAAAGGGMTGAAGTADVSDAVDRLPGDTAVALAYAVPHDYARQLVDEMAQLSGEDAGQLVAQAETMTGLDLPDDLQTLLGTGVTLSLGGTPPELSTVTSPADVPFGATITGNTDKIEGLIHKIEERQGFSLDSLGIVEKARDGRVALASSAAYADEVLGNGDLARSSAFRQVVPEAGTASSVAYVDFDSRWVGALEQLAGETGAPAADLAKVKANLAPLKAFGASTWQDGGTSHVLVKLTTD
jgi:hypothetical protein